MKRLISTLLTAALLLAITACDNNSGENNQGGGNNNQGGNNASSSPFSNANVGDIIEMGQINWLVIAVQDGRALILSEDVLEQRAYHDTATAITWEHSSLREFLNGSFYNTTFTEQEKEWIHETANLNSDNPENGTSGGNDTVDKIFLLSIDEVNEYMGDNAHINIRNARNVESWWWLRSPGTRSDFATYVLRDGRVYVYGSPVSGDGGVRPALWLNL
jgi:hypothetical protein